MLGGGSAMTVIASGKAALFTLTLMVVTAYTALCAPPHLWPDQVEGAPANTALYMKGFEEPRPLFMQVKTVSIRYGSPILINGEMVPHPIAEGTLAFRTVFGVRVGGVTLGRDGPRGEDGS